MWNTDSPIPERLVLRAGQPVAEGQPLRGREGGEFVRGPIPVAWLARAADISGSAPYVGIVLWHIARLRGEPFHVSHRDWARFHINWRTGTALLGKLAAHELILLDPKKGKASAVQLKRPRA